MGYPAITYTLSNGATSDANQVNTNYTDIINGLSDGTKDLNIAALTAAGTATFNGSVTIGNASADDLTINASVASNIVFKTTATYNIGSSTIAPASIYLGNGSYTMRILPGTLSSTWTLTLPATVPSITGQSLIFNTSGTAEFRYPDKFTATKTANYTATGDETVIPCDPTTGTASFTVSLPAASTCAGKSLTIIKIDAGLTYTVTIDPDGSETINGATTYVLYTQWESVTIKCNGTAWYISDHFSKVTPQSYSPAMNGFGTCTNYNMFWDRDGRWMNIWGHLDAGTVAASTARLTLPTGATLDTTVAGTAGYSSFGIWYDTEAISGSLPSASAGPWPIIYESGQTSSVALSTSQGTSVNLATENGNSSVGTNDTLCFQCRVPISGWNA